MSIFGTITSVVVGKAVGAIFGGEGKDGTTVAPTYTTTAPQRPTGLLARSVQSGRQALRAPEEIRTALRGVSPEGAPKGLKSVDPMFISSETAFWAGIINKAINQAQKTLPTSLKEQHGIFRR